MKTCPKWIEVSKGDFFKICIQVKTRKTAANNANTELKPIVLNLSQFCIIQLGFFDAIHCGAFSGLCVSGLAQIVGSASRRLAGNYALCQNTANPVPLFASNRISVQNQRGHAAHT